MNMNMNIDSQVKARLINNSKFSPYSKMNKISILKQVKTDKNEMFIDVQKQLIFSINKFLFKKYNCLPQSFNSMKLDNIIKNKSTREVSIFKDNMIFDSNDELLRRFYLKSEYYERIGILANYYKNYLKFFCNPIFRDLIANEIIQSYGNNKAEFYYKNNYLTPNSNNIIEIEKNKINKCKLEKKKSKKCGESFKLIFGQTLKEEIQNISYTVYNSEYHSIIQENFTQDMDKRNIKQSIKMPHFQKIFSPESLGKTNSNKSEKSDRENDSIYLNILNVLNSKKNDNRNQNSTLSLCNIEEYTEPSILIPPNASKVVENQIIYKNSNHIPNQNVFYIQNFNSYNLGNVGGIQGVPLTNSTNINEMCNMNIFASQMNHEYKLNNELKKTNSILDMNGIVNKNTNQIFYEEKKLVNNDNFVKKNQQSKTNNNSKCDKVENNKHIYSLKNKLFDGKMIINIKKDNPNSNLNEILNNKNLNGKTNSNNKLDMLLKRPVSTIEIQNNYKYDEVTIEDETMRAEYNNDNFNCKNLKSNVFINNSEQVNDPKLKYMSGSKVVTRNPSLYQINKNNSNLLYKTLENNINSNLNSENSHNLIKKEDISSNIMLINNNNNEAKINEVKFSSPITLSSFTNKGNESNGSKAMTTSRNNSSIKANFISNANLTNNNQNISNNKKYLNNGDQQIKKLVSSVSRNRTINLKEDLKISPITIVNENKNNKIFINNNVNHQLNQFRSFNNASPFLNIENVIKYNNMNKAVPIKDNLNKYEKLALNIQDNNDKMIKMIENNNEIEDKNKIQNNKFQTNSTKITSSNKSTIVCNKNDNSTNIINSSIKNSNSEFINDEESKRNVKTINLNNNLNEMSKSKTRNNLNSNITKFPSHNTKMEFLTYEESYNPSNINKSKEGVSQSKVPFNKVAFSSYNNPSKDVKIINEAKSNDETYKDCKIKKNNNCNSKINSLTNLNVNGENFNSYDENYNNFHSNLNDYRPKYNSKPNSNKNSYGNILIKEMKETVVTETSELNPNNINSNINMLFNDHVKPIINNNQSRNNQNLIYESNNKITKTVSNDLQSNTKVFYQTNNVNTNKISKNGMLQNHVTNTTGINSFSKAIKSNNLVKSKPDTISNNTNTLKLKMNINQPISTNTLVNSKLDNKDKSSFNVDLKIQINNNLSKLAKEKQINNQESNSNIKKTNYKSSITGLIEDCENFKNVNDIKGEKKELINNDNKAIGVDKFIEIKYEKNKSDIFEKITSNTKTVKNEKNKDQTNFNSNKNHGLVMNNLNNNGFHQQNNSHINKISTSKSKK